MERNPVEFEQYVKSLFEQLGYIATPQREVGARRTDLIIEKIDDFLQMERILVECKTGRSDLINSNSYAKFNTTFLENRSSVGLRRAMFVYDCKVSQHIQRSAPMRPEEAQLLHISQLEARAFGVSTAQLAERASAELREVNAFVDPGVIDVCSQTIATNSFTEIAKWAMLPGNFSFVIGEIGSGKTALLTQFARSMNASGRFPVYLLIPLRYYDPIHHREPLLECAAHHLRTTGLIADCNVRILKSLLLLNIIVLIFDGIDEVRLLLSEDQTNDMLLHWIEELQPLSGAIFSCRSSYFYSYFNELAAREGNDRPQIPISILSVRSFDMDAISRFASLSGATSIMEAFNRHGATPLMKRPLFLSTAQRLPDLGRLIGQSISDVEFVEESVKIMLQHSRIKRISRRDVPEWIELLTGLARQILGGTSSRLDRANVAAAMREVWAEGIPDSDLEKLTHDAMFRSILEGGAGSFEFAHSVFEEYFFARALTRTKLLPLSGLLAIESRDVSSNFAQAAYDHFLSQRAQNPDSTVFREKYGIRWCLIPSGVIICRHLDSKHREMRKVRVISNEFWITQTPITPAQIGRRLDLIRDTHLRTRIQQGQDLGEASNSPLTRITHRQAEQICVDAFGGRLPNLTEWQWACMPFQSHKYYLQIGNLPHVPLIDDLIAGPWGVKGGLRSVWQWTSTYDSELRSYVCCGGYWDDEADGARDWWLLPRKIRHPRTGVRVVVDAKNFEKSP